MKVDQVWAYREKKQAELLEVTIRAVRTAYPPRVRVEFMDARFGGDTKWVPAGRLKCPWGERANLLEYEARWSEVQADGRPNPDERDAAQQVFWDLAPDAIELYYNGAMGIGEISDLDRLVEVLGWEREEISGSPGALSDGSVLRIRWFLTRRIARELVRRSPARAMRLAMKERSLVNQWVDERVEKTLDHAPWLKEAEVRAETEEKYDSDFARARIIETWVGVDELLRHAEHEALVQRFDQLARLARRAAPLLRDRRTKSANKLADDIEAVATASPPTSP